MLFEEAGGMAALSMKLLAKLHIVTLLSKNAIAGCGGGAGQGRPLRNLGHCFFRPNWQGQWLCGLLFVEPAAKYAAKSDEIRKHMQKNPAIL
jgi:hypothetical protein